VTGFALTRLPEGSLLSEAGLLPGDVLLEVNGTPIDSLATLAGLFTRLRGESEIQASILRGGSPVALTVRLK
jgi:serine protease Do